MKTCELCSDKFKENKSMSNKEVLDYNMGLNHNVCDECCVKYLADDKGGVNK